MTKRRLWRVDITHQMGYQAPSLLIETEEFLKYKAEKEAIKLAKSMTRLSDFDCWKLTAICTEKRIRNGKWYTQAQIDAHL
jgi:hypothetical protein